jgi:hypothetical protein
MGEKSSRARRSAQQLTLLADETERVTCRIRIDPPAAITLADVKQGGAEFEDLFLCLIEILDRQIEVKLP